MSKLNKTERAVMVEFLDRLADAMGNAGCNDYTLPDSPEGKLLWVDAETEAGEPLPLPTAVGPFYTQDFMVLAALRKKLGLESPQ